MNQNLQRQKAIENYLTAYNNFNVAGMVADLHQDIAFKNISNGEVNVEISGLENFRKQAESAKHLFSQRMQTIKEIQFEKEVVSVNIAYTGTLATGLPNGMQAGDTIQLEGKSVFRFQGDKIIEIVDIS